MRNPDLIASVGVNENTLIDIPQDIEPFYPQEYDPFDDTSMKKYFSDLKKVVRGSFEYQNLISFLRHMGLDHCSIMTNLTNDGKSHVKIEIHHHPFDLETICRVVYKKRLSTGEPTDIRSTAYEVMWNHYSLLIGLIPLCETVHELVHSGVLFLDVNKVYGFFSQFVERYRMFFEPEDLETYEKIVAESNNITQDYSTILDQNNIAVDMHMKDPMSAIKDIQKLTYNVLTTAQTSDQKLLSNNVINEVKPKPKVIGVEDLFTRRD